MFLSHIFITTTTTATVVIRDFLNCSHPSFMFIFFILCVCACLCACFMSMLSVKDFCVPLCFWKGGIWSHVLLVGPDVRQFIWFFCSHSFFHSFIFPFPLFHCFESPLLCKCFLIFVFSLNNMWYVSVGGIEVNRFILFWLWSKTSFF